MFIEIIFIDKFNINIYISIRIWQTDGDGYSVILELMIWEIKKI